MYRNQTRQGGHRREGQAFWHSIVSALMGMLDWAVPCCGMHNLKILLGQITIRWNFKSSHDKDGDSVFTWPYLEWKSILETLASRDKALCLSSRVVCSECRLIPSGYSCICVQDEIAFLKRNDRLVGPGHSSASDSTFTVIDEPHCHSNLFSQWQNKPGQMEAHSFIPPHLPTWSSLLMILSFSQDTPSKDENHPLQGLAILLHRALPWMGAAVI